MGWGICDPSGGVRQTRGMSSPDELTAAERSVLGHLDEHALVESLMELVRIPSMGGTDAEVEVQEVAAGMLRDLGTDVDRWDIDLEELDRRPVVPRASR